MPNDDGNKYLDPTFNPMIKIDNDILLEEEPEEDNLSDFRAPMGGWPETSPDVDIEQKARVALEKNPGGIFVCAGERLEIVDGKPILANYITQTKVGLANVSEETLARIREALGVE